MKQICLHFEIHQPTYLRRYRFFDIATNHYYYDSYANADHISEVAERSYIPALSCFLEMARRYEGQFKFSIGLSGVASEMLESNAPEVIDLLKELGKTGCCEFTAVPYSYGLSALYNEDVFKSQVQRQMDRIKELFGATPTVLSNTELLYDDDIATQVASMGFKGILTEGAKHVLGWKSSHYVYSAGNAPKLGVLLRDFKLSDDISLRFSDPTWSEYPLFADKYVGWIDQMPEEEQIFNIFMNLEALGMTQPLSSNILEFLKALPEIAREKGIGFITPGEAFDTLKPVGEVYVPFPMTWLDEERDTSSLIGNSMQREAISKLYSVADRVLMCRDRRIKQEFDLLQSSDYFHMMSTKNTGIPVDRGFYDSAYDAFTNYMNILGDFIKRVDSLFPVDIENEELNALLTTIRNQDAEIQKLTRMLETGKGAVEETSPKKAAVRKSAPSKAKKPAAAPKEAAAADVKAEETVKEEKPKSKTKTKAAKK